QDLARIDSAFDESVGEIRSAQIVVSELAKFLQHYNAGIEFNPERLEFIRERLGALEMLKRKYGGSLESVLAYRAEIGEAYALAADFAGAIARVSKAIDEAERELSKAAIELSDRRRTTAEGIESAVVAELSRLGISHARFDVRFEREEAADGHIRIVDDSGVERRYRAREAGVDLVSFFLSTNVGEEPKPLVRVASGGEVSRIMLALKSVLARSERLPILVFDEIDTGVSGVIARKVGECMRDLAAFHQIIAITHLPQIAAMGQRHFLVEKSVADGRTRTSIRALDEDERTAQVAALMSGDEITEAALESARQLIR
ncbi:MAG TPA: DNA repair protein RecN, partial [Rhodothermales bacterium]